MGIDELKQEASKMSWTARYRYVFFVGFIIIISLILVVVGMWLYSSSGAYLVDLSRPGFQSVRQEATDATEHEDTYPAAGPLDDAAFEAFYEAYDRHAARVIDTNGFSPEALSDESLGLFLDRE